MPSYFFNRDKVTGLPAKRSGRSSAPHLYHSKAKAAMHVGGNYEQVEVMLVDATKPLQLTQDQLALALKQASRIGVDVTEDGDMVPCFSFSTVELQMLFNSVLAIAHGNGQVATSQN